MLPGKALLSYLLVSTCMFLTRGQKDVNPGIQERLEALEDLVKVQQLRLDQQSKLIASQQEGLAEQQSRIEKLESIVATTQTSSSQPETRNDHYPSEFVQSKHGQNQFSFVNFKTRTTQGPPNSLISWTTASTANFKTGNTNKMPPKRNFVGDQPEKENPAVPAYYKTNKRFLTENSSPVAFHALNDQNATNHVGIHQKIMFELVLLNLGAGYNNLHGVFRAPAAGVYIFYTSIMSHEANNQSKIELEILKNGAVLSRVWAPGTTNVAVQGSTTVATQLSVGDEMWVSLIYPADGAYWGRAFTSFMGCLVYPF